MFRLKEMLQLQKLVDKASIWLFMLALPLVLIVANVNWAFNSLSLYKYGFNKYQVPAYTGISLQDLVNASEQMVRFFNSQEGFPEISVAKNGQASRLFNEREILHLEDVRSLLHRFAAVQKAALVYVAVYTGLALWLSRGLALRSLLGAVVKSGVGTTATLALLGIASLVGFDQLFLQFHLISFSNDLWRLDPWRDYLLMMFPQGFWFDATILVGLATCLEALALAGGAGALTMVLKSRRVDA